MRDVIRTHQRMGRFSFGRLVPKIALVAGVATYIGFQIYTGSDLVFLLEALVDNESIDGLSGTLSKAQIELAAVFALVGSVYILLGTSSRSHFIADNADPPSRRREISALILCCRNEITIVAGRFAAITYDSDEVLFALRKIPLSAKVNLFVTDHYVDPNAIRFLEAVAERKWEIRCVNKKAEHIIVVDKAHTRFETDRNGDDERRSAKYQYGNAPRARRLLNTFMSDPQIGALIDLKTGKPEPSLVKVPEFA